MTTIFDHTTRLLLTLVISALLGFLLFPGEDVLTFTGWSSFLITVARGYYWRWCAFGWRRDTPDTIIIVAVEEEEDEHE